MVRFGAFWGAIFYSLAACFTRKITELMALKKPPPVMCIKLFVFS